MRSMLDGLSPSVLAKLGPWGLLILVMTVLTVSLIRGWLIPKSTVEKNYQILEGQATKAETREAVWQQAAMTWQATAQEAVANREEQLEQGRTLIQLLSSVPRGTGRRGGN